MMAGRFCGIHCTIFFFPIINDGECYHDYVVLGQEQILWLAHVTNGFQIAHTITGFELFFCHLTICWHAEIGRLHFDR